MPLPFCQVALCTSDLPQSIRFFVEGLGFAPSGSRALWGERVARIMGVGPDAALLMWWLVGRQDFMQVELFNHTLPAQRPLRADWRPSDLGWIRWGVAIPDFDETLERLLRLGVAPLTEPVEVDGLRRVCVREPGTRVLVELMEDGPALLDGIPRPSFHDLAPAVVYATVSVSDLDLARRFLLDAIGLEETAVHLHRPEDEALWELEGASSERFLARAGDGLIEVVRYLDPAPRGRLNDYLPSDQGFLNVAFGARDPATAQAAFERIVGAGLSPNAALPVGISGGTYVDFEPGTSIELMVCPRELDTWSGFTPLPRTPARLAPPAV